jgi:hypothetical protein
MLLLLLLLLLLPTSLLLPLLLLSLGHRCRSCCLACQCCCCCRHCCCYCCCCCHCGRPPGAAVPLRSRPPTLAYFFRRDWRKACVGWAVNTSSTVWLHSDWRGGAAGQQQAQQRQQAAAVSRSNARQPVSQTEMGSNARQRYKTDRKQQVQQRATSIGRDILLMLLL